MRTIATRDPSQNKVHSYHRQQVALDLEQRLTHLAMAYDRMIKHAASETMRVSITLDMGSDRSEDDGGAGAGALRKRHTRKRWPTVRTAANIETKGASFGHPIRLDAQDTLDQSRQYIKKKTIYTLLGTHTHTVSLSVSLFLSLF
jgi:hypothetical protein